jgi:hypothetical protein
MIHTIDSSIGRSQSDVGARTFTAACIELILIIVAVCSAYSRDDGFAGAGVLAMTVLGASIFSGVGLFMATLGLWISRGMPLLDRKYRLFAAVIHGVVLFVVMDMFWIPWLVR